MCWCKHDWFLSLNSIIELQWSTWNNAEQYAGTARHLTRHLTRHCTRHCTRHLLTMLSLLFCWKTHCYDYEKLHPNCNPRGWMVGIHNRNLHLTLAHRIILPDRRPPNFIAKSNLSYKKSPSRTKSICILLDFSDEESLFWLHKSSQRKQCSKLPVIILLSF